MKIDINNPVKICIIGMQGAGKTELVKKLVKQFKKPLVYGVYPEEWKNEDVVIYKPSDFSINAFEKFSFDLIQLQTKNKTYDCLIIDDADLFFNKNSLSLFPNINRLIISQRQLKLSLIFISKRPQNLSTKIYENSDYIFIFAVEGVNVKKYLLNLHDEMINLLGFLSREKHNFILKEIGKEPILYSSLKIKEISKEEEREKKKEN